MFFSGDSSARKRVDLGGRSSKERDRQKLLEQTRLERDRRMFQRKQNSAAIRIQRCFRGRRVVKAEHRKLREQFFMTYGGKCQNVNRQCFSPDSEFLRQLLFFFNAKCSADVAALVETCRLLLRFVQRNEAILMQLSISNKPSNINQVTEHTVDICWVSKTLNEFQLKQKALTPIIRVLKYILRPEIVMRQL